MQAAGATGRFADLRHHRQVDSTNRVAADLARAGTADGVVVVADHQTAGRGRLDRRWEAPPGSSLLVSILVRPAPPLALVALALAAADTCAAVVGVRPQLKWPNDLVVEGAKVGGLLGETVGDAAVVGLGLNANWGDAVPPAGGISLDRIAGGPVDREALLGALLERFEARLSAPAEGLVGDYRAACTTLGRQVAVQLGDRTITGRAADITAAGHLLVTTASGSQTVAAGDVIHVRAGNST